MRSRQARIEIRQINVSAAFSSRRVSGDWLLVIAFTNRLTAISWRSGARDVWRILPDTQQLGSGVQVGVGNWQAQLEANKQAFALAFVTRSRFTNAFAATLTPAQFVDSLFSNAGVTPSTSERNAAIAEFGAATNTTDNAARGRA